MFRFLLAFLSFLSLQSASAQASGTATVSVSIMQAVGTHEFSQEKMLELASTVSNGKGAEIGGAAEVGVAAFRVIGDAFVYAVDLRPEEKKNALPRKKKGPVGSVVAIPSCHTTEAYVINSVLKQSDTAPIEPGDEAVAITVHFN